MADAPPEPKVINSSGRVFAMFSRSRSPLRAATNSSRAGSPGSPPAPMHLQLSSHSS